MTEVKDLKYDSFHSTSNAILQQIDSKKRVLDVGCATGRLGEKMKNEKQCYVVGIEVDEKSSDAAKERCDKVIVANIEELENIPFHLGYFNVMVFADVLEHLRAPEVVLRNLRKYLSDDGYVIASIPNVANWTLRLKLLSGVWNYKKYGLLDKTHLRLFTLKTARELFEESGYKIQHVTCTSGNSYIDWRMPLKNPANVWKNLLACQFIIKATKCRTIAPHHI